MDHVLPELIVPILSNILSDFIKNQYRRTITDLQRKEEASEILVAFKPKLNQDERNNLATEIRSNTLVKEKADILKDIQIKIDEQAIESLKKIKPQKREVNYPGVSSVEQDLLRISDNSIDSSWLANIIRLNATPSMIRDLSTNEQVAFIIPKA